MPGTHRLPTLPRVFALVTTLGLAAGAIAPTLAPPPVRAVPSPNIVISQVYGGGGNSGATYTNDFIELFNRGTTTVDVSTWSVQYFAGRCGATSHGSRRTWPAQIPPGGYYLIQEAAGAGGHRAAANPGRRRARSR